MYRHHLAGPPFAAVVGAFEIGHRAPSLRKAHHLFEFTSLSIRISSTCSAMIFFIASFSRSSSLSLLTIETCMPAYLDFQRYKVCSEMLWLRTTSFVAIPFPAACRIRTICSSVKRFCMDSSFEKS